MFQPGNLNGSCVRDLVAGDIFENSPPSSLVPLVMVHMNVDEMLSKVVLRDRGASLVLPEEVLDTPGEF